MELGGLYWYIGISIAPLGGGACELDSGAIR